MTDHPAVPNPMGRQVTVNLTAASTQVLAPNPRRSALLFSSSTTLPYAVNFGEAASFDNGIHIPAGFPPHTFLTREMIGDLICGSVNVLSTGVGTVGILEVVSQ